MNYNIPSFTSQGNLPKGIHKCSGNEFIERYCNSEYRKDFEKTIADVFDFAKEKNSGFLFFGGSFITSNEKPRDIDCLMVFTKDEYIPPRTERLLIEGTCLDIMFGSFESRDLIDSHVHLFSIGRNGLEVGVIQVNLYDTNEEWEVRQPGAEEYEIVKRAYINRHFVDVYRPNGILVTIHGLLSYGEWNKEIAPIASSQGWIFAPFIYKDNTPDLLLNSKNRSEIVNEFRRWIFDISSRFEGNISIIAHSFGTYIIAAYLEGFEESPVSFNSVILTGSIINVDFDWEKHRGPKVARVLNEKAPNDVWVNFMPQTDLKRLIGLDKLFGKSGVVGFSKKSEILKESCNEIYTHTNVIKRDVIETKWMPYLNANRFAHWEEMSKFYKKEQAAYSNSEKPIDTTIKVF